MEFCHALTQLVMFQPLSGMGDLRLVFKIRLFLPLPGRIVFSYGVSFPAVKVCRLMFRTLTRL
jgi:hypothetical protein